MNQQTGCFPTGSDSRPVTRRSTRATNASVGNVAGAVYQRPVPVDQIERHVRAEIARMHRHPITEVRQQLGRRSDEYRDVVTRCERLAQHVAAQRSRRAQDDDAVPVHCHGAASNDGSVPSAAGSGSLRARFSSKCHFQIS
jgi:hypothetical protein